MNLANRPWKLYLRLTVVTVVLLAVLLVLFKNRSNYVHVWFFGLTGDNRINVIWLILTTALGTISARRVFVFSRGLWRDLRAAAGSETAPPAPAVGDKASTVDSKRPPGADADLGMERE